MSHRRLYATLFATLLAMIQLGGVAKAASVAGGITASGSPGSLGGAIILTSRAPLPSLPIEVQGSVLGLASKVGGYAVTAEIRGLTGGGFGGAYFGGGLGIGNIARNHQVGSVVTLFAGKSIAPFTSIEIRAYQALHDSGSTVGFLGLRFTF